MNETLSTCRLVSLFLLLSVGMSEVVAQKSVRQYRERYGSRYDQVVGTKRGACKVPSYSELNQFSKRKRPRVGILAGYTSTVYGGVIANLPLNSYFSLQTKGLAVPLQVREQTQSGHTLNVDLWYAQVPVQIKLAIGNRFKFHIALGVYYAQMLWGSYNLQTTYWGEQSGSVGGSGFNTSEIGWQTGIGVGGNRWAIELDLSRSWQSLYKQDVPENTSDPIRFLKGSNREIVGAAVYFLF